MSRTIKLMVALIVLFVPSGKIRAATDYRVFANPATLGTHNDAFIQLAINMTPADHLNVYTLDGQVLVQFTGARRLPNGTFPAPEAAKLRAFAAQLDKASGVTSSARWDAPLGCFRTLATAMMGAPKVDRRVAIILGVSPLQVFSNKGDAPYSCAKDVYPGDGLLVKPSPYSVIRQGADGVEAPYKDLDGLDVVWQMPDLPDSGAAFKTAIQRFWLHHLQLRGARALLLDGTVADALRVGSQPTVAFDERTDALKKDQVGMVRMTTTVKPSAALPVAEPSEDTAAPAVPDVQQLEVEVPEIQKSNTVPVAPPVALEPPKVTLQALLWDHEAVDGDRVALWLDGQPLRRELILGAEPVRVELELMPGEHRLAVKALDDGAEGPTTVTVRIVEPSDDSTLQEHALSLDVGKTGELTIASHPAN